MNYDNYLQLNKILDAQLPASFLKGNAQHDEMFFIILHQTHELWFKQIIYEIDFIIKEFASPSVNLPAIINKLERIISIFQILIESINAIETLSPTDFLEFRKLLTPASGLHSKQFKLMLLKFGLHQERTNIKTLFDSADNWLTNLFLFITSEKEFKQTYFISLKAWINEETQQLAQNEELNQAQKNFFLVKIHEHAEYCQNFLNFDYYNELLRQKLRVMSFNSSCCILFIMGAKDKSEYFIYYRIISLLQKVNLFITKWQIAHAQVVKNIIGNKLGTGGAYTAEELIKNKKMAFDDITDLITLLIPKQAI